MEEAHPELTELRKQIDVLDDELLRVLAQRMEKAHRVGKYKKNKGLQPLDEQRWRAVLNAQLEKAGKLNLSEEFITEIYELIHSYALQIETEEAES